MNLQVQLSFTFRIGDVCTVTLRVHVYTLPQSTYIGITLRPRYASLAFRVKFVGCISGGGSNEIQ